MSTATVVHCWADRPSEPDGECPHPEWTEECGKTCWAGIHFGPSATCMLLDGHDGPHDFTNDGQIGLTFKEARE